LHDSAEVTSSVELETELSVYGVRTLWAQDTYVVRQFGNTAEVYRMLWQ